MEKYKNILKFYSEYIKLEQILRKGWLMCNVPADRIESVADHTLQLIMLANVLTKEFNIEIDEHKLTEMLMIHDLGEVIIGDVSDVEDNREVKKSKEAEAVKSLFKNLNSQNEEYYYSLWLEMESQSTPLSKFAYLLDKIDAVIKASIYEEEYNMQGLFEEFYGLQDQRGSFENTQLEEFFKYLGSKYIENKDVNFLK